MTELFIGRKCDFVVRSVLNISVQIVAGVRYAFEQHSVKVMITPNKLDTICREFGQVRPALGRVPLPRSILARRKARGQDEDPQWRDTKLE